VKPGVVPSRRPAAGSQRRRPSSSALNSSAPSLKNRPAGPGTVATSTAVSTRHWSSSSVRVVSKALHDVGGAAAAQGLAVGLQQGAEVLQFRLVGQAGGAAGGTAGRWARPAFCAAICSAAASSSSSAEVAARETAAGVSLGLPARSWA
jgi:hypothetical protein